MQAANPRIGDPQRAEATRSGLEPGEHGGKLTEPGVIPTL